MDKEKQKIFNIKVTLSVQQFFSITLLLLIMAQTFSVAIKDKMSQRIPEALDYYTRCITTALSSLQYNLSG
jgi:hypothetical protein